MLPIAIHADRAFTPFEEISDAVVVIQGSKISAVGQRGKVAMPRGAREMSARGKTIVPGFVDVHIHGAGGRRDCERNGNLPQHRGHREVHP